MLDYEKIVNKVPTIDVTKCKSISLNILLRNIRMELTLHKNDENMKKECISKINDFIQKLSLIHI
jgi:translation initiation factor 2B subunit (eIF-2B alpha/beta/delta family)